MRNRKAFARVDYGRNLSYSGKNGLEFRMDMYVILYKESCMRNESGSRGVFEEIFIHRFE